MATDAVSVGPRSFACRRRACGRANSFHAWAAAAGFRASCLHAKRLERAGAAILPAGSDGGRGASDARMERNAWFSLRGCQLLQHAVPAGVSRSTWIVPEGPRTYFRFQRHDSHGEYFVGFVRPAQREQYQSRWGRVPGLAEPANDSAFGWAITLSGRGPCDPGMALKLLHRAGRLAEQKAR